MSIHQYTSSKIDPQEEAKAFIHSQYSNLGLYLRQKDTLSPQPVHFCDVTTFNFLSLRTIYIIIHNTQMV